MTESFNTDAVETHPVFVNATENEKPRISAERVLPLYSEEVAVSKRRVDRAVVRVTTVTYSRDTVVNEQLTHERVEVARVAIGRVIEVVPPPIREEGDITIIPVVEEVVVVERRLVLKEEVRLRKVRVTEQHQETVDLREQDAVVTRIEAGVNLVI